MLDLMFCSQKKLRAQFLQIWVIHLYPDILLHSQYVMLFMYFFHREVHMLTLFLFHPCVNLHHYVLCIKLADTLHPIHNFLHLVWFNMFWKLYSQYIIFKFFLIFLIEAPWSASTSPHDESGKQFCRWNCDNRTPGNAWQGQPHPGMSSQGIEQRIPAILRNIQVRHIISYSKYEQKWLTNRYLWILKLLSNDYG